MKRNAPNVDPFGLTANPSLYVARPATEEALRRIRILLEQGQRPVALVGPPGMGKTMLLRVLTLQLERRYRMVFVPHPTLSAPDLCAWSLSLLGEEPDSDPERALLRRAEDEKSARSALLLVVDDADTMPVATARRLGELARGSNQALRLLVTAADDVRAGRFLAALDPDGDEVRLVEPMSEVETARYVEARLESALAPPAVRARFEGARIAQLHAASGGVPRRVNEIASRILEGRAEPDVERRATVELEKVAAAEPVATEAPDEGPPFTLSAPSRRRRFGVEPGRPGPIRRSAPPGLLVPLGVAALVAIAAVVIPLITPRIVRDLSPPADAGVPAPPARDFEVAAPPVAALPKVPAPTPDPAGTPGASPEEAPTEPPRPEALAALPNAESPPDETPMPTIQPVSVSVNAQPWAEIEVDGVVVGVTPLAGLPLLPGAHVIRARMPDGRTLERRVEIGPEARHFSFQ